MHDVLYQVSIVPYKNPKYSGS